MSEPETTEEPQEEHDPIAAAEAEAQAEAAQAETPAGGAQQTEGAQAAPAPETTDETEPEPEPDEKESKRKLTQQWAAHEKRSAKLRRNVDRFRQDKQQFETQKQHIDAQLARLRSGDPAQALDALAVLTGARDGTDAYEQLTQSVLGNPSPRQAPSPEVEELRARIGQLEGQVTRGEYDRGVRYAMSMVESPERFPLLSAEAQYDPDAYIAGLAQESQRMLDDGEEPDIELAAAKLETRLRQKYEAYQRAKGERGTPAQVGSGREPGAPKGAQPEQPQRPARTVTEALQPAEGASERPMTEEELLADAVNYLPAWLKTGR